MEGMRRFARLLVMGLAVAAAAWPMRAAAQEVALADRAPRFFQASARGGAPVEIDAARNALLRQVVSLNVERPTVGRLLEEVERQTGLRFYYGQEVLSPDRPVSLRADSITVATALVGILMDAGVDAVLSGGRRVALVKKRQGWTVGTVTGRVTDVKTNEGLGGAEVILEGTRWRAATAQDGRYRLTEVEPGTYTLTVRRVGYAKQSRAVTVVDGQEVTIDVALQPVATQLNEIVTTVTGDQRRVELGHVVGRINADSVVREAPVSNLSELLNGRVPGLQVFQNQGTVGGQVRLQIRGPNTLLLNAEPIVIVDGVRHTTIGSGSVGQPFFSEPTSRLNDLNPNDIETIEVVKGPSAATLYGTDAANGVLVVTTKRGRTGPARWNAYARAAKNEIPSPHFPDTWWGWSDEFGTSFSCALASHAQHFCTQDSVTVLSNPLNDPELTLFGGKPSWEYGANVAGGRQDLRYYFSGDFEDATGPLQMPRAIMEQLKQERGLSELPEEWRNPNAFTKLNLQANVSAVLGETGDLRVNTGYIRRATRSLAGDQRAAYVSATMNNPTNPYGDGFGTVGSNPAESFLMTSTDRSDRFVGSASGQWRPAAWLAARATAGLDLTGSSRYSLARRGDAPTDLSARNGLVADERVRQVATTAELGVTATLRRGRLSARTAAGAQYVRNLSDVLYARGSNLPPGGSSVGEAASISGFQRYAETVTLGGYLEETLGFNDRLFVTGALRVDGASAFGRDYDATAYPKVSASWLLSEEQFIPRLPGLEELRLRYAYGTSGQQPTPAMGQPGFAAARSVENGATITIMNLVGLGNPNIRPERVREHEFGFDATALGNRLRLDLTWYHRRTVDQIVPLDLAAGLGLIYTNLGLTTQHGFEAELTARLLETRLLSWDLTLQHGVHRTKLVDLGDALGQRSREGGFVEGYPLGARFQRPLLGYTDANGDGIIVPAELQLGDTAMYVGESTPPRSQTLTTVLGFFERRVRLSALLERRMGFTQINSLGCRNDTCREAVDPSTPVAEQAEALRRTDLAPEKGDFTRLREVTAALELPRGLARALRVRSATLALSARNLALWTDFSGPDPESAASAGTLSHISNALSSDASGIPQARSWALRLDLGF